MKNSYINKNSILIIRYSNSKYSFQTLGLYIYSDCDKKNGIKLPLFSSLVRSSKLEQERAHLGSYPARTRKRFNELVSTRRRGR